MPAILTLNKLNTSSVIRFYFVIYFTITLVAFGYKFAHLTQDDTTTGTTGSSFISQMDTISVPMLQLIPTYTLYTPWTLLTSTFVETNVFKFLVSIPFLYHGLNFLSKNWDNTGLQFNSQFLRSMVKNEIVKYLTFVIFTTNIVTVLNYIVFAILLQDQTILSSPINHGLLTILMSFIVVLKQLKPEVSLKYLGGMRVKQIPFACYLSSCGLSIVFRTLTPFLPISNNFLMSWYYLRFIQKDYSPVFEFVEFFPEFMKQVLNPLFNLIAMLAKFLGFIPNSAPTTSAVHESILPISTSDVAERRRQVALKVLEERIDIQQQGSQDQNKS